MDLAKHAQTPVTDIVFDITANPTRIALVEQLRGRSGWLRLQHLEIKSFEAQEYLLFSGFTDEGDNIDQESCEKLFHCLARVGDAIQANEAVQARLDADCTRHVQATLARNLEENNRHLSEACVQLDKWAEDMEKAAAKEMDDTKRLIADVRRQVRQAPTMQEQSVLQAELQRLEKTRRNQQQRIFAVEDEIGAKRDSLVQQLTKRMEQKTTAKALFTIRWKVI